MFCLPGFCNPFLLLLVLCSWPLFRNTPLVNEAPRLQALKDRKYETWNGATFNCAMAATSAACPCWDPEEASPGKSGEADQMFASIPADEALSLLESEWVLSAVCGIQKCLHMWKWIQKTALNPIYFFGVMSPTCHPSRNGKTRLTLQICWNVSWGSEVSGFSLDLKPKYVGGHTKQCMQFMLNFQVQIYKCNN